MALSMKRAAGGAGGSQAEREAVFSYTKMLMLLEVRRDALRAMAMLSSSNALSANDGEIAEGTPWPIASQPRSFCLSP